MINSLSETFGEWLYFKADFLKTGDRRNLELNFINSIYEVIRIVKGVPLFIEDHYMRFRTSADKLGISDIPSIEKIRLIIKELCSKNVILKGNIRFELFINQAEKIFSVYQVPHIYPTTQQYENGVQLVTFAIERLDPQIKQSIVNSSVRSRISELQKKSGAYEIVLVNQNNEITEGSKSNILFISESKIYSPLKTLILEGITRKKLIELVYRSQLEFIEKNIGIESLSQFEACILTGTSPKILPVSSINGISFNPQHVLVQKLMHIFEQHIREYCKNYIAGYF